VNFKDYERECQEDTREGMVFGSDIILYMEPGIGERKIGLKSFAVREPAADASLEKRQTEARQHVDLLPDLRCRDGSKPSGWTLSKRRSHEGFDRSGRVWGGGPTYISWSRRATSGKREIKGEHEEALDVL